MKTLILAAGRFGQALKDRIAEGREPRLDVFELARVLEADVLDYDSVDRDPALRVLARLGRSLGQSPAVAYLGFQARHRYDAILSTGEDIGLALAALLRTSGAECSHTMIAHTLFPKKKRLFFDYLGVERRIDRILAYSTSEQQHMTSRLHIPADKVELLYYHADESFFVPDGSAVEPDLICAAGQLLRDYDCLVDAVRELPVRLQIAAGSPWIDQRLRPTRALPTNVTWGSLPRAELRALYSRSALAVVPILQNEYQTGIATILEMMAMGKCVIATRTHGQTDTIIDGVNGVYVPPGDASALRQAISKLLAEPERAAEIGRAARRFIEENAGLDRFVDRVATAVRAGHVQRARTRAPEQEARSRASKPS